VIESQNLATWSIQGEHLSELSEKLRATPGVDQTVVFGAALHASGRDHAALERAIRQATAGTTLRMEPIETGLEDVFIYLMSHSKDNFGAQT
jgi:ABC-2 type transport system ATP-binding protein